MAKKYLDNNGLSHLGVLLKEKIGSKVDKVEGKGLSTNDFTDDYKTKLDNAGTSTFSGSYNDLTNKPDLTTYENDIENINVNGTAQAITNKTVNITVPTKTSDITNDSNFVTDDNYVHTDNNYTTDEKTKLTNIETNAEVNIIESVKVNGTAQAITNKEIDITVPTNNNQLTNGAGYQTATDVSSAITTAIGSITGVSYEVVTELPTTGQAGTIYLISNGGKNSNIYDEYIYVNSSFEKIGTTEVDLTNYVKSTDLEVITNGEIDTIFAE